MYINLKEIKDQGQDFTFTRKDAEITRVLDDILCGNDFEINVRITPAGNAYDLRGTITTQLQEACSYCANEFKLPLSLRFHELVLVGTKTRCDIKGSESDFSDPELDATQIEGFELNFGETIHEQIAIAEPLQPVCREGCKGLCFQCGADQNESPCGCIAPEIKKESVFSVLKDIKLN